MNPRSKMYPWWWYACWYTVVGLNVFIMGDVFLELLNVVPELDTWPLSGITVLLMVPLVVETTRTGWKINAEARETFAKTITRHLPDQHGYCTACAPLEMWPCTWHKLSLAMIEDCQPGWFERLVTRRG